MNEIKKYYLIDYPFGHHGFFAQLNFALGQLDYAFENSMIPVIDWSKSQFLENNMGSNPFDYYFDGNEDIRNIDIQNSTLCPRVFEFIVQGKKYTWPVGYPPRCSKLFLYKDVVTNLNRLFNNYFSIKKDILSEINPDITKYKTLGVHCRRSDMMDYHNECVFCTETVDFFERTIKVFNDGNFERIYIATEEQEILDYFIQNIGDKLIYQNCHRIPTNSSSDFWHNPNENIRKSHKYLIGKEVLLDAISLSNCNSLLTAISGVTYGSIILNGLKYENVYYFDEIKQNKI